MALRWRRTIDVSPHMFSQPAAAEDDWLLYCGPWLVGRVSRAGGAHREMISWSLTGPHTPEAPGAKVGITDDVDAAKTQLIAAFRAWAAWAGIQSEGSEASRWVPGDADDWLLFSGGFMRAQLLDAWRTWLAWAELPAPDPGSAVLSPSSVR
jgi:hypothetical protein